MNKAELAEKLAADKDGRFDKTRVLVVIEALFDAIVEELKAGGEVTITGFGCFTSRVRTERMGVNPQNPTEKIMIPAVRVPKFKAGHTLKTALKG